MNSDDALAVLARRVGVHDAFTDMNATVRQIGPETQRALLAANGIEARDDQAVRASLALLDAEASQRVLPHDLIVAAGQSSKHDAGVAITWSLVSEDEHNLIAEGRSDGVLALPALEVGIYLLVVKAQALPKR